MLLVVFIEEEAGGVDGIEAIGRSSGTHAVTLGAVTVDRHREAVETVHRNVSTAHDDCGTTKKERCGRQIEWSEEVTMKEEVA